MFMMTRNMVIPTAVAMSALEVKVSLPKGKKMRAREARKQIMDRIYYEPRLSF